MGQLLTRRSSGSASLNWDHVVATFEERIGDRRTVNDTGEAADR